MTYLDWAATALPDPDVMHAMAEAAVEFSGNPSSAYPAGKAARAALEDARRRCAAVLGCAPENLAFTSGGTESDAIVLLSRLLMREPGTVLIGGLEHPAVAEPARMLGNLGWKVKELPPETDGRISPERLKAALEKNSDTRLVAVMGVNNELGSIMPLDDLTEVVRNFQAGGRPVHFHADMVQAVGKAAVNLAALDIDTAAVSAHKFRGPRGVGLLYHRNPKFEALIRGGGQEHGVRPGTENLAGAHAMAIALEKWGRPGDTVAELGHWLLEELAGMDGARIVPETRQRSTERKNYVPGIIAVSFPPVPGEVLARILAESGYAVSTGSACSSNKKGKLPKAMVALGVAKDVATGMIRVSLGPTTTREELEGFLEALRSHVSVLSRVNRRG